jgi:hypothetical protein
VAAGEGPGWLNTDDRMLVEFGFARTVGQRKVFSLADVLVAARRRGEQLPELVGGPVDRARVGAERLLMYTLDLTPAPLALAVTDRDRRRVEVHDAFLAGDHRGVLERWQGADLEAVAPLELAMLAEARAEVGDEGALSLADSLADLSPAEADAVRARYALRVGDLQEATDSLGRVFERLRVDPWPSALIMERSLDLAGELVAADPGRAPELFAELATPFAVRVLEWRRRELLLEIGKAIDAEHVAAVLRGYEPHVPWQREFLATRMLCYEEVGDPLAERARWDLEAFLRAEPVLFSDTLR